jgi:beta-lactamase regulating signal transducer with metallopeptidase domain
MDMIFDTINSFGKVFVVLALPMLVQSGIVIGLLLLVERLLQKNVRAVYRYWLGILVLVQLILPPSQFLRVSLGHLLGGATGYISGNTQMASLRALDFGQVTSTSLITWQGVVFLVWLTVAVIMGVVLLKRAIVAGRLVRRASKSNLLMNDLLVYCCKCMGVDSRKVQLKISNEGTSPAVYGLFRPVILVPRNLAPSLGSRHLRAVLLHELAHIKRGDLLVNWVQTILQIIYFYNPLLWLANSKISRIREQAVDETVLAAMGQKLQRYPEMLADVARLTFNRPALSLGLTGVAEHQNFITSWIKPHLSLLLRKIA